MSDPNKPSGQVFEISTFDDILALPTIEMVERCAADIVAGLVQSRASIDLIKASLTRLGSELPKQILAEPLKFYWTDDGDKECGEVSFQEEGGKVLFTIKTGKEKS